MNPGLDPRGETSTRGFLLMDAGLADYESMYETQLALVERKKRGETIHDYLILVEHPEVYTFGRKSKDPVTKDLPQAFLVERGGDVTYHNPGQLVAYPILALAPDERDLHRYLRGLENVLIGVLSEFGIEGTRRVGATGVWTQGKAKKIASIGVAVSGWVTYHGVALNVDNDLSGFARIRPCGFPSEVMTSLAAELGDRCPRLGEVKEAFLRHFSRQFGRFLLV